MIDEKTLPPPDRALNAASPPPAYPEPSSHHIPEISSSASPPTLTPASTPVAYPSQAPPNLSQSRSQSSFRSPMGSPPEPATMSPPVQGAETQQYPQGYPYPPAHQQQQPKGELVYAPPPQFPPGSMQQMQMDAQLGAQFQQQLYARCARGEHDIEEKHGVCGIITAVLLFPIGLICLFMDVEKKCSRCGALVA